MELSNDVRVIGSVLLALPIGALLTWLRFRERQWMLSWRRRRAARKLFQNSAWEKAAPLDLHFALTDAFGRSVERIELAYIEARQSPARLLMDRIEAGQWVKYSEESNEYIDPRLPWAQRWLPFGRVSRITTIAASLSVSLFLLLVLLTWQSGGGVAGALIGVLGIFCFWMMLMLSLMADAANRILTPGRYPPVVALPKRTKRPGAKGKRSESPTAVQEATVGVILS